MNKNVYIIDSNFEYDYLFKSLGFNLAGMLDEADLICFTGGEDVTPSMYGAYQHSLTYNNPIRDAVEKNIFNRYIDVPKVGICRGAQFLNVMSGGKMYQHVEGHTQDHYVFDVETTTEILCSSTHHQMMQAGRGAELVAYDARDKSFKREWFYNAEYRECVENAGIEVLFYRNTSSLCFQPHPEFVISYESYRECADYFDSLLSRFFNM